MSELSNTLFALLKELQLFFWLFHFQLQDIILMFSLPFYLKLLEQTHRNKLNDEHGTGNKKTTYIQQKVVICDIIQNVVI